MTKHGIGSRVVASLAFTALTVMMGCADLPDDDQRAANEDVSQADEATEVAARQFTPPSNSGELSGENIRIDSVTATGNGCPKGTWSAEMVPEGNAFTLTFDKYSINAPATTTRTITTLPCNLSLKIRTPKSLSYAITSFQYYGYANLAGGMKGTLLADYAFTGFGVAPAFKTFRKDFPIPYDSTYAYNDDIIARGVAPSWASCNITSSLQVRTRLVLETANRDTPGILSMDNIDARAEAALKINFRTGRCPTAPSF